VKQVILLKMEPSADQHQALLKTLEAFNAGCQYAADVAFQTRCANKIALQPKVYRGLRARFRLSAQMAIRAIAKAVEAYKRDRRVPPRIKPHGAMVYDERIMSFQGQTAVDSDAEVHTGEAIRDCRRRYLKLRQGLQKAGTKSAKRHLQKVKRKESRFVKHVNHFISKQLVQKASLGQRALALEDLTGIRERATVRKSQRYERLSWAFRQLRSFVAYKCEAAGVPLLLVEARNTSRTCPVCGHCAKENRRSQSEFLCVKCGFQAHADVVGATNVARGAEKARGNVTCPMVSTGVARSAPVVGQGQSPSR
jgi:IS605 OrfB family transposase